MKNVSPGKDPEGHVFQPFSVFVSDLDFGNVFGRIVVRFGAILKLF